MRRAPAPQNRGAFPVYRQRRRRSAEWFDKKLFSGFLAVIPAGRSVIDIGAGTGHYVRAMRKHGYEATGVDGSACIERLSRGAVSRMDLTGNCVAAYGSADWGIFVEVGEHIPEQYEQHVFDTVARIPREGLIVSWAPPFQEGYGHINNRTEAYVAVNFARRGWWVDEELTVKARGAAGKFHPFRLTVMRRFHCFIDHW